MIIPFLLPSTGELRLPLVENRQASLHLCAPSRGIAPILCDGTVLRVLARAVLYVFPKLSNVIAVINLEYMML